MTAEEDNLFDLLIKLCNDIAWSQPTDADRLYALTQEGLYPERIYKLAEAFGMMLVKVEGREFQNAQLINDLSLRNAQLEDARAQLMQKHTNLLRTVQENYVGNHLVGNSQAIRRALSLALAIARRPINTLLLGDSGTGKEVFAKLIHVHSPRKEGPFIAINCTAIPESLFESEVFGIEKGIATGVSARKGYIEEASGGTLFLDELGELSLLHQAKLLRVIEERAVVRVGSSKPVPVDINIIAATNIDLALAVQEGRFREDLYYRLNVAEIILPALRERGDDILLLAQFFLEKHCTTKGRAPLSISLSAREVLLHYAWPGNVRELQNEMERAAALAPEHVLEACDLSPRILSAMPRQCTNSTQANAEQCPAPTLFPLEAMERQCVRAALAQSKTRTEAAALLGITREGLRKKLLRMGITENTME
jgi:transcriptional regulator with PAS, ATPase and Fis domain